MSNFSIAIRAKDAVVLFQGTNNENGTTNLHVDVNGAHINDFNNFNTRFDNIDRSRVGEVFRELHANGVEFRPRDLWIAAHHLSNCLDGNDDINLVYDKLRGVNTAELDDFAVQTLKGNVIDMAENEHQTTPTTVRATDFMRGQGVNVYEVDQTPARDSAPAEQAESADETKKYATYAKVRVPSSFLHPYTFTAKDGREFEKAYVQLAPGTKVNGIDLGGYSCDVFMTDYMKQQMLAGNMPTLRFNVDEPVSVWTGHKGDELHPYKRFEVKPFDLVHGIKSEFEDFKRAKAAERDTEKVHDGPAGLADEAKATDAASATLAGHGDGAKESVAQHFGDERAQA